MKYYTIVFPGEFDQHVQETWTKEQLLKSPYYTRWVYKMCEANLHEMINDDLFVDEWMIINWATETNQFGDPLPVK